MSESKNVDTSANSGKEQEVESIPFKELALKIYDERVAGKNKPDQLFTFFAAKPDAWHGPRLPSVGFYCDPSWLDMNSTKINILGVDSAINSRIGNHEIRGIDLTDIWSPMVRNMNTYRVYDFDVDKLGDPTVTDDLEEIKSDDILVVTNEKDAIKIKSYVVDPKIRRRINEWMRVTVNVGEDVGEFIKRSKQLTKYVRLRQVPFNKKNEPDSYKYTYEGVKDEIQHGSKGLIRGGVQTIDHYFDQEDLKWLQEFMKNKGIPIPE